MGHHPVYAGTTKEVRERADLQQRLRPLLDRHGVDLSVAGHIHNFQHIRVPGSTVDWVVNSSASKSRKVVPFDGARFASPETGFSLCSVSETELTLTFVNADGKILYQYTRTE
jgi:3',5'-cyclic AMP phosphodiesterase CpdA